MQVLRRPSFLLSLALVLGLAMATDDGISGTTGKIAGKVIDKASKEGLPGANVIIQGTALGAVTNFDGEFIILNIPPGSYAVKASLIGYGEVVTNDVRVSIDVTTKLDFELGETVLQTGETVVVVAQRDLIQKDLTATTAIVDDKSIQSLPVTEVNEVITLQAGVVEKDGLHIRGGRAGEVAYWIDGVPVTDSYDGSTVVDVNKNLVQELQVISGAFNAEYGQALSGVVNIATKEGSDNLGGSITTYFGDYFSTHDKFSWGPYPAPFDDEAVPSVPLFRDIKNINPAAIRNFEGSLYGPLVHDKFYFNVSGRYIYFDGWLRGQRRYNPQNIGFLDDTTLVFIPSRLRSKYRSASDSSAFGDGEFVPMNWNRKIYGQAKLIYNIRPTMKLANTTIWDDVEYEEFDRAYVLNPDGNLNKFRQGFTNILKLTHTLSSRTFYDLAVSYSEKLFKQYVYEKLDDPRYVHPDLLTYNESAWRFHTGGVNMQHFNRRTSTMLAKLDLTSQATNRHQIKAGVELRRHRAFFEDITLQQSIAGGFNKYTSSPFIETRVPGVDEFGHNRFTHHPSEISGYLQDKIELQDFIVNVGVRVDYFDPDGKILADPTDPNIYQPIKLENRLRTLDERRQYWYRDAGTKLQVSPRLGVSFPVTAGGVFHFSFGQFFQIPKFERLYENSDFKLDIGGTGNIGVIGNADLKPEQTTNGEIGLKQQLTENSSLEVTAYFRDIRDLTSTRSDVIETFTGALYNKYVNADFGFVRGVILSYTKRFAGGFAATADYTYQIAKASNSDPNAARNAVTSGQLPEVQLSAVNWDQRHTLNISASYSGGSWGGGLIVQASSGQPYTPRRVEDISTIATNTESKPSNLNVDLRLYKDFSLAKNLKISVFGRVFNLLDRLNQVNVFDDTGQADFTTDRNRAILTNQNPQTPVNLIDEFYTNPTHYSEPRRIEVGTTITF
jgi:outer membrane receptor protein involved in Fe transport